MWLKVKIVVQRKVATFPIIVGVVLDHTCVIPYGIPNTEYRNMLEMLEMLVKLTKLWAIMVGVAGTGTATWCCCSTRAPFHARTARARYQACVPQYFAHTP